MVIPAGGLAELRMGEWHVEEPLLVKKVQSATTAMRHIASVS
jgi:hypothetical protein